jgi:Right handed beta helix region
VRPVDVTRLGAGVALTLALGACRGPAAISIGAATTVDAKEVFLSPTGLDRNPGTRDKPWRTFGFALPHLGAGSTLTLLDGTYDGGTTGYFDARCGSNGGALNGDPGNPVTVRAENQRAAFLRGDATGPPFFIDACSNWTIDGLRVESDDLQNAPDTIDAGSVVVVGANNHGLVLRHLLARHPNRFKHAHVLRIGDRSTDILVEECELYDFHHNAVEIWRTDNVTFRRNYVNGRGLSDIKGGFASDDASGGDFGFLLEETRNVIAENNIIENVHDGFGVVGRDTGLPADMPPPVDNPIDSNHLLGNVVLQPAGSGVRIDSRCLGQTLCDPPRIVRRTELVDDVIIGGAAGVSSAGAIGTSIQQVTVIGAANGFLFVKEPPNTGLQSTSDTVNSLAVVQAEAFRATGEANWSFDHCAAMSSIGPISYYVPDDGHVTSKVAVPSDLGGCLVYLPAASALKHAGKGTNDVGANVLSRYEGGQLTPMPLWTTGTGAFPCGAVVAGVNDDPATSCLGVHKRLHVAAPDCPLP